MNMKLSYNDKIIENINAKLETLCSSVKSQMSFNKMIETQIAASILVTDTERIPWQSETSTKFVHAATKNEGRKVLPTDYKC